MSPAPTKHPLSHKFATLDASNLIILSQDTLASLECLCLRMLYLLRSEVPQYITICTLSNEMTKTILSTLKKHNNGQFDEEIFSKLNIGTFHALCCQFLRKHASIMNLDPQFQVISASESKYYLQEIINEHQQKNQIIFPHLSLDKIFNHISECKLDLVSPGTFLKEIVMSETDEEKQKEYIFLYEIYYQYEKLKEQTNVLDYDDLLFKTIELFNTHPHVYTQRQNLTQHILIHDFHRLNDLQYEIFKKISNDSISITFTAHSQSDAKYIKYFQDDYGEYKIVSLDNENDSEEEDEERYMTSRGKSSGTERSRDDSSNTSIRRRSMREASPDSLHNEDIYNPLAPLCEGTLAWKWNNAEVDLESSIVSQSSTGKGSVSETRSQILHTTLHRGNLLFGYRTTEDYVPKYCVRIAEVHERGQLNIDIVTKDDKYHQQDASLSLRAETEEMRSEWMEFFENSKKDMYNSESGKGRIPMPELFHQRALVGEVDASKVFFPIIEGPEPFKNQIQSNFQFLRRILEDTHNHAEALLMEEVKSRFGGAPNLKQELAKVAHVSRFQQQEVIDMQNMNMSGNLVCREDVEAWLMQWSKLLTDSSVPPVSEEKDRLVMHKIIQELERKLDSVQEAEDVEQVESIQHEVDLEHEEIFEDDEQSTGSVDNEDNALHVSRESVSLNRSILSTSSEKQSKRVHEEITLKVEEVDFGVLQKNSPRSFTSATSPSSRKDSRNDIDLNKSIDILLTHEEDKSTIAGSQQLKSASTSSLSSLTREPSSPMHLRPTQSNQPATDQQDFFSIFETIRRLEQKMDQLEGSEADAREKDTIREEFKNTLRKISQSGFFHNRAQEARSPVVAESESAPSQSTISPSQKSATKDIDLLRDMQQFLGGGSAPASSTRLLNTSTREEQPQRNPPHPSPYPQQEHPSTTSDDERSSPARHNSQTATITAADDDSLDTDSEDVNSSTPTTHVRLNEITPSLASKRGTSSSNVSFSQEVSVKLYTKQHEDSQHANTREEDSDLGSTPPRMRVTQGGVSTPQFFRMQNESQTMTPTSRVSVENMLKTGRSFWLLSSDRSHKKKLRHFCISDDCKYLCWSHPDRKNLKKKSGKTPLSNILCIQRGEEVQKRRNQVIKTSFAGGLLGIKKEESKVQPENLFSIVCNDRSFDLEARNSQEAQLWSKAFEQYLRSTSSFSAGYKAPLREE